MAETVLKDVEAIIVVRRAVTKRFSCNLHIVDDGIHISLATEQNPEFRQGLRGFINGDLAFSQAYENEVRRGLLPYTDIRRVFMRKFRNGKYDLSFQYWRTPVHHWWKLGYREFSLTEEQFSVAKATLLGMLALRGRIKLSRSVRVG